MDADRPFRPAGVLAVHSLNHFALCVPALDAAADFYGAFGLGIQRRSDSLVLSTADGQRCGLVYRGERKQVHHLSFALDASDLLPFVRRLQALGVALEKPATDLHPDAVWFRDPEGTLFEVAVAARTTPGSKRFKGLAAQAEGLRAAERLYAAHGGGAGQPLRLGHVMLFASDVSRAIGFHEQVLGLRLSDRSGANVAFMHAPHGSDHHMLAFARSSRPGFHHASFDVASPDEIGLGAGHMARRGFERGWGLGRHMAGSNYFHYVQDPWGSFAEYSCDMDYIPAGSDWVAKDLPPEHSLHVWGPEVPDYFLHNAEAVP